MQWVLMSIYHINSTVLASPASRDIQIQIQISLLLHLSLFSFTCYSFQTLSSFLSVPSQPHLLLFPSYSPNRASVTVDEIQGRKADPEPLLVDRKQPGQAVQVLDDDRALA